MRSAVGAPADWRSFEPIAGTQPPVAGSWRSRTRSMSVAGPPDGDVQDRAKVIGWPALRVKVQLSPLGQSRSPSRSASFQSPLQLSCA